MVRCATLGTTRRRAVAGLLTALVGAGLSISAPAEAADGGTALAPVTQLAAVVQPVVLSITTEYHGELVLKEMINNKAALHDLQQTLWAQQRSGKLARDLQSINRQWLSIIAGQPSEFNTPGKSMPVKVSLKTQCSAWLATPDGYVVTGAHCVTMTPKSELAAFKSKVLPKYVTKDFKKSIKRFRADHVPLDQDMLNKLHTISEVWYDEHSTLAETSTTVTAELAVKGKSLQRDTEKVPAEVISVGKAYPGRDVALLKISGYTHLPSLALGDEKRLQVGDRLFVVGFPGPVSSNTDFSASSRKEPTFTEGLLNASRTTTKGVAYLQTQAPAYHGNSGGPVLDQTGKVVGILIAGSVDQNTGDIVAGEQFVLTATEISRELTGHGVTATSSPATTRYAAALSDYSRGYYKRALTGFASVTEVFPEHPYVANYVNLSRERVSAGDDRTPRAFPWAAVIIGFGVIVVVLTVIALVVVRRRRGRVAPAEMAFATPLPSATVSPSVPVVPPVIQPGPPGANNPFAPP